MKLPLTKKQKERDEDNRTDDNEMVTKHNKVGTKSAMSSLEGQLMCGNKEKS